MKKIFFLLLFANISLAVSAQINVYLGGNLQGNYSWMGGDESTFEPGFGGGVGFFYWEYEYWFFKTGIDYHFKQSSHLDYGEDLGREPINQEDRIQIDCSMHTVGIPLTMYFRPYEKGPNTLLLTASVEAVLAGSTKESATEDGQYLEYTSGFSLSPKANVGVGIGYQRQLDRYTYLNIVPSFNVDIRAPKTFTSITLTAELVFGIY